MARLFALAVLFTSLFTVPHVNSLDYTRHVLIYPCSELRCL